MNHAEEIIAALCLYGKQTGTQLRNATGLDHDTVYSVLAWLDATGRAIMVRRKVAGLRTKTFWELA